MAYDFDGVDDKIDTTLTAHAALRSYAAWLWHDTTGEGGFGSFLMKGTTNSEWLYVSSGTPRKINYDRYRSTSKGRWNCPTVDDAWFHICITYNSGNTTNNPVMFMNGTSQTVTESTTPVGTLTDNAGVYIVGNKSAQTGTWDGKIAEVAIWDRILTQAEATALAAGYSPLFFPLNRVLYCPLIRDLINYHGGVLTATGGPTVISHPRIIYPSIQNIIHVPAVAGFNPAWARNSNIMIGI